MDIPVKGVRNSWEAVATNSLLSWSISLNLVTSCSSKIAPKTLPASVATGVIAN